jgi:hypothetical protein
MKEPKNLSFQGTRVATSQAQFEKVFLLLFLQKKKILPLARSPAFPDHCATQQGSFPHDQHARL